MADVVREFLGDDRRARIALALASQPGDPLTSYLVEENGPAGALRCASDFAAGIIDAGAQLNEWARDLMTRFDPKRLVESWTRPTTPTPRSSLPATRRGLHGWMDESLWRRWRSGPSATFLGSGRILAAWRSRWSGQRTRRSQARSPRPDSRPTSPLKATG